MISLFCFLTLQLKYISPCSLQRLLDTALRASIVLSEIYTSYGKHEEALNALNTIGESAIDEGIKLLFHIAKISKLLDSEKYDEAVSLSDKLLANKDLNAKRAPALF